jgi:DNA-binding NarL/FixJ family response regulator
MKRLSEREVEVLTLIARGFSNHEIAPRLRVSDDTVKSHVGNILAKLEAHTRAQAVAVWLGSEHRSTFRRELERRIERAR